MYCPAANLYNSKLQYDLKVALTHIFRMQVFRNCFINTKLRDHVQPMIFKILPVHGPNMTHFQPFISQDYSTEFNNMSPNTRLY